MRPDHCDASHENETFVYFIIVIILADHKWAAILFIESHSFLWVSFVIDWPTVLSFLFSFTLVKFVISFVLICNEFYQVTCDIVTIYMLPAKPDFRTN